MSHWRGLRILIVILLAFTVKRNFMDFFSCKVHWSSTLKEFIGIGDLIESATDELLWLYKLNMLHFRVNCLINSHDELRKNNNHRQYVNIQEITCLSDSIDVIHWIQGNFYTELRYHHSTYDPTESLTLLSRQTQSSWHTITWYLPRRIQQRNFDKITLFQRSIFFFKKCWPTKSTRLKT